MSPPQRAQTLLATARLGCGVLAPAAAGTVLAAVGQYVAPSVPITGAIGLVVALGLWAQRRSWVGRGQGYEALAAALSAAGPIAFLAWKALDARFDPPSSVGAFPILDDFPLGVLAVTGLVLLGVVAALLGRYVRPNGSHLYAAACGGWILCTLLLGCSLWRSHRYPDPDARNHLTGVPSISLLPPVSEDPPVGAFDQRERRIAFPDGHVFRSCERRTQRGGYACTFTLRQATEVFTLRAMETVRVSSLAIDAEPRGGSPDAPMIVRRLPDGTLWLVDLEGHPLAAGNSHSPVVPLRVRDLASVLAPPVGWQVSCGVMLLVSALALLYATRTRHLLVRLDARRDPARAHLEEEFSVQAGAAAVIALLGGTPLGVAALAGMLF